MKYVALFGVAGLGLLVTVVAVVAGRESAPFVTAPAATAAPAASPSASAPPSPVAATPAATSKPPPKAVDPVPVEAAGQAADLLAKVFAQTEAERTSGVKPPPEQLQERREWQKEAGKLVKSLGDFLRYDPRTWKGVVELLAARPDVNHAARVSGMISRFGLHEDAVPALAALMDAASPYPVRHVAAAALAGGEGDAALKALMAGAEKDADSRVRNAAMTGVGNHFRKLPAGEARTALEDYLRRRAAEESDPGVKQIVTSLLAGQAPAQGPGPGPGRPRPKPFRRP